MKGKFYGGPLHIVKCVMAEDRYEGKINHGGPLHIVKCVMAKDRYEGKINHGGPLHIVKCVMAKDRYEGKKNKLTEAISDHARGVIGGKKREGP